MKDLIMILLTIACFIAIGTTKDWRIAVIGATAFGAMCESFGKAENEKK